MADLKFQNRRDFLKYALGASAAVLSMPAQLQASALYKKGFSKLTILYTNDQHSRIEPFPQNDAKHAGEGGFARRAKLIESIRKEENNILLLDAGDIFQGTPYFNFFKGELEYKLMSLMGYDAVTFGNHDFDLGVENIIRQMPHATFDFLNCNYDLKNTDLFNHPKVLPYKIYKKGNLKIGVFGVGIDLNGLIDPKLREGIVYNNPIENANKTAEILKKEKACDYVICLSHLGYSYDTNKVSDKVLVKETKNIDLVIGGHTHTFLNEPVKSTNSEGAETLITQVGWAGIWLGRIDVFFTPNNKKILQNNSNQKI